MKKRTATVITNDPVLRSALTELLEQTHLDVVGEHREDDVDVVIVHMNPWPKGWGLGRLRNTPATTRCLVLGAAPTDGPFLMVGLPNSTYVPLPVPAAQLVEQLHWVPGNG